ncbi:MULTISPECIES: TerB family tellurite resistance protein [Flavobacteriaceae]|uniref:TerB family tellurite resistance protein n=2 Tax=Flavobacteriaceae TaxID=49546 RepID=A0A4Y8AT55_9FLAO|nr:MULTISPECIES: TerB family tellurite resistance protein [Flavobacteriaceae]TEW73846.1 TerB family tellurite resistance protein [Gramella jeungdoensis]GGK38085.1 fructose 1,6-bisphosphatase [Lutibacter litoralis]
MMSISDLYPTGLHEQNIGHFASIVRLALLDNKIDAEEHRLLERLAVRLDITKSEFEAILKNPKKYPVNPPFSYEERLEHLYDLTKMMFLDKNPTIDKTSLMDRIAIGLGFPLENARAIVKEAIKFFLKEPDMEDFKKVIKNVNPMKH